MAPDTAPTGDQGRITAAACPRCGGFDHELCSSDGRAVRVRTTWPSADRCYHGFPHSWRVENVPSVVCARCPARKDTLTGQVSVNG